MCCAFVCTTLLSDAIPSTTVYPISYAIPFLHWLLVRYQAVLSLCTPACPVLSISAIPLYNCLPCVPLISAIRLYNCLPCAISLWSPFTSVYPMLSDSAIPLYYCLPCAVNLCYPPFNCLPYAFSLCYPPFLLSTLCFLSLPSPMHFKLSTLSYL